MRNDQSSIHRWTWIIALLLAILLLWMLLSGHGPSNTCCSQTEGAATAAPAETGVQSFSFAATDDEIKTVGDASNIAWLAQGDKLRAILDAGDDLKLEGNDKTVKLTGFAITDAERQKKGDELQDFFGPEVTVDNQLTVIDSAAAVPAPSTVKLYFDTGKTSLPDDADHVLSATVEWLKANPDSKAVLSGYHDARGDQASNQALAKDRAKAVREALKTAGVDEARIEMRKPEVVEGGSDLQEARRVEVSVE